jgi:hypothetical protein
MDAFYWFSVTVDQSASRDSDDSRHSNTEESSEVPHSDLHSSSSAFSSIPRLSPQLSSTSSFLVLPPCLHRPLFPGVSVLTPMNSTTTGPPLQPLGVSSFPDTRCTWRLLRPNPDGTYRCTRNGNHTVGGQRVCGHHRVRAGQYHLRRLNWHFSVTRPELPGGPERRDETGRFTVRTVDRRPIIQPITGLNITDRLHMSNGTDVTVLGHIVSFKTDAIRRLTEASDHLYTGDSHCPICLESGTTDQSTNPVIRCDCGHPMHLDCLGDLITTHPRPRYAYESDSFKCPLCRVSILSTVIQHRHLAFHRRFVREGDLLSVLSSDVDDIDWVITVLANERRQIHYFSNKTPSIIIQFWETLATGLELPTEVQEYNTETGILATPQYDPVSPIGSPRHERSETVQPTEASQVTQATQQEAPPSTPPGIQTIDISDSPPAAPRRTRRRLNPPSATAWERPRTLFMTVPIGSVTRAPNTPSRTVGIDLTELIRRFEAGEHVQVFHGANDQHTTHYSVTAIESEDGRRTLTVVIQ